MWLAAWGSGQGSDWETRLMLSQECGAPARSWANSSAGSGMIRLNRLAMMAPLPKTDCLSCASRSALDHFELVEGGRGRAGRCHFLLIPEDRRGDVILQRQVAPAGAPAQRLDRHPDVALEADRVHHVPAVHAEALLAAVQPIRAQD